jgi:uncharacterized alkaline shock family protein YloU/broad-specificity NMP kinase
VGVVKLLEAGVFHHPDEVIALVGPSGTGKSHAALLLAQELHSDVIIDDGLLIEESRILAGRSAKREQTMVAAVRRAIFTEPEHAAQVREGLAIRQPRRVLIIGTSRGMVNRIAERLELPRPHRYIGISEVSSAEEIQRALRERREQNKHVIPAPTFEVKKTFSGYLVHPLQLLLRPRGTHAPDYVVEKSVVRPTYSSLGRFFIADSVLMSIAIKACLEVEGVARVLKVTLDDLPEGVEVNVDISLLYGCRPMTVLIEVQHRVKQILEHMTAVNVVRANVAGKKMELEAGHRPH